MLPYEEISRKKKEKYFKMSIAEFALAWKICNVQNPTLIALIYR